jgi:hypothetical protein
MSRIALWGITWDHRRAVDPLCRGIPATCGFGWKVAGSSRGICAAKSARGNCSIGSRGFIVRAGRPYKARDSLPPVHSQLDPCRAKLERSWRPVPPVLLWGRLLFQSNSDYRGWHPNMKIPDIKSSLTNERSGSRCCPFFVDVRPGTTVGSRKTNQLHVAILQAYLLKREG